ncbi:MAG TPA: flagellar biosynthetic protein FliR [Steroidobacteraceae bacterium]|nr:flagellar biosynthetic protein FliR [Steroidobacteraceae bacterium]
MQPLVINVGDLSQTALKFWWPMLRIGGFVATAPQLSSTAVPGRIKIVMTVALVVLIAPLVPQPVGMSIFSGAGFLCAVKELLIGVAIGMMVQLAFEALTLAGQTAAMTMGLGFATLVDPQHGATTTVVGQLFLVFATLIYLAVNGHLVLLGALSNSFQTLPIGAPNIDRNFLWAVASWGASVFETGLLIALPAVIALVIVNLALGVVTRAAPQLNLFGVGFPITMLAGYLILIVGSDGIMVGISSLIHNSLVAAAALVTPSAGVP